MIKVEVYDHLSRQLTEARREKWIAILKGFCLILVMLVSGMASALVYNRLVILIPTIGIFISSIVMYKRLDIESKVQVLKVLVHGAKGEAELRKTLKRGLGDDYTCFFGIPVDGKGDFDCLVIGPDSVFAIESKHHGGIIDERDEDLVQIKIGRRGSFYPGKLKRPVWQLGSTIHKFKEMLKEEKIDVWMEGLLVFTNSDARVRQGKIRNVTVVRKDKLCTWIAAGAQNKTSKKQQDALITYLLGLTV